MHTPRVVDSETSLTYSRGNAILSSPFNRQFLNVFYVACCTTEQNTIIFCRMTQRKPCFVIDGSESRGVQHIYLWCMPTGCHVYRNFSNLRTKRIYLVVDFYWDNNLLTLTSVKDKINKTGSLLIEHAMRTLLQYWVQ